MANRDKNKLLLARKEELLKEINYYEQRIEEARHIKTSPGCFDYDDSSDSDPEFNLDTGPSIKELQLEQEKLQTCLQATEELTNLHVLQSEVNILVDDPVLQEERPVPEAGVWREVTAECRVDLVPFSITFYAHKPDRPFAPVSYRGLRVMAVKTAHEGELAKSVLSALKRPSDAVEVLRSYAVAHRSRRSTLARLAERYANSLFMEPLADGGYILKCAGLLEVAWVLQNKWSPVAPFHHRLKFELEYMDESYIKVITQAHRQLSDPSLETDERTLLMAKIISTCLEAKGPTQELYDSMESDHEASKLRSRRTTLDQEPENMPLTPKDNEVMAPPKSLPKKAKRGKENEIVPVKRLKTDEGNVNDNVRQNSAKKARKEGNDLVNSKRDSVVKRSVEETNNKEAAKNIKEKNREIKSNDKINLKSKDHVTKSKENKESSQMTDTHNTNSKDNEIKNSKMKEQKSQKNQNASKDTEIDGRENDPKNSKSNKEVKSKTNMQTNKPEKELNSEENVVKYKTNTIINKQKPNKEINSQENVDKTNTTDKTQKKTDLNKNNKMSTLKSKSDTNLQKNKKSVTKKNFDDAKSENDKINVVNKIKSKGSVQNSNTITKDSNVNNNKVNIISSTETIKKSDIKKPTEIASKSDQNKKNKVSNDKHAKGNTVADNSKTGIENPKTGKENKNTGMENPKIGIANPKPGMEYPKKGKDKQNIPAENPSTKSKEVIAITKPSKNNVLQKVEKNSVTANQANKNKDNIKNIINKQTDTKSLNQNLNKKDMKKNLSPKPRSNINALKNKVKPIKIHNNPKKSLGTITKSATKPNNNTDLKKSEKYSKIPQIKSNSAEKTAKNLLRISPRKLATLKKTVKDMKILPKQATNIPRLLKKPISKT